MSVTLSISLFSLTLHHSVSFGPSPYLSLSLSAWQPCATVSVGGRSIYVNLIVWAMFNCVLSCVQFLLVKIVVNSFVVSFKSNIFKTSTILWSVFGYTVMLRYHILWLFVVFFTVIMISGRLFDTCFKIKIYLVGIFQWKYALCLQRPYLQHEARTMCPSTLCAFSHLGIF